MKIVTYTAYKYLNIETGEIRTEKFFEPDKAIGLTLLTQNYPLPDVNPWMLIDISLTTAFTAQTTNAAAANEVFGATTFPTGTQATANGYCRIDDSIPSILPTDWFPSRLAKPLDFDVFPVMDGIFPTSEWSQGPINLGLRFTPATTGLVKGIKFFKPVTATSTNAYKVMLWQTDNGALLASVDCNPNYTQAAWIGVNFAVPVIVKQDVEYVATFHSEAEFAYEHNYYNQATQYGPLDCPVAAGVYSEGAYSVYPGSCYAGSCYFVAPIFFSPTRAVQASSTYVLTPDPIIPPAVPIQGAVTTYQYTNATPSTVYIPWKADNPAKITPVAHTLVGTTTVVMPTVVEAAASTTEYEPVPAPQIFLFPAIALLLDEAAAALAEAAAIYAVNYQLSEYSFDILVQDGQAVAAEEELQVVEQELATSSSGISTAYARITEAQVKIEEAGTDSAGISNVPRDLIEYRNTISTNAVNLSNAIQKTTVRIGFLRGKIAEALTYVRFIDAATLQALNMKQELEEIVEGFGTAWETGDWGRLLDLYQDFIGILHDFKPLQNAVINVLRFVPSLAGGVDAALSEAFDALIRADAWITWLLTL